MAKYIAMSGEPTPDELRDDGLYQRDVEAKASAQRRFKRESSYNKKGLAFLVNLLPTDQIQQAIAQSA